MQVTHWPKEDYGKFFNGDSYIILNTYKEKDSEVNLSLLWGDMVYAIILQHSNLMSNE